MRNKGVVVVLSVVITALCLYYLSFTLVSRSVEKEATKYGTDENGVIHLAKKQHYLDSLWNQPVYNLFGLEYTFKEVKENELSLGLDLQGGMHVVLEISPSDIVKELAINGDDPIIVSAISKAKVGYKKGNLNFADVFYSEFVKENPGRKIAPFFASTANQSRISISDDDDAVVKFLKDEIESAIDRSFTILKTRIDQFGTSQPNIQRLQQSGRIQIEIPGADNPKRVRKLLQGVARLEFWEVAEYNASYQDPQLAQALQGINQILVSEENEKLNASIKSESDSSKVATTLPKDTASLSTLEKQLNKSPGDSTINNTDSLSRKGLSKLFSLSNAQLPFLYKVSDTSIINNIFKREEIKKLMPTNIRWIWDLKPDPDLTPEVEDIRLNFVKVGRNSKPLLTGEVINNARMEFDQYARPAVSMTMDAFGSRSWAKITARISSQTPQGRIAIVLDNFVYTAPTVNGEIPNGNSQITGSFTLEEAKDLANVLKAGSLPAPTRIVEEAIVWPSLGAVAQNQGLISVALGFVLVVIFMVFYYAKGGAIADFSLLFNVFFILGILAQLNAALTLPGIAGIVLTMGMAVDANVLIYERIREELRQGRKLREAVKLGYDRAFSAIFDSNITTFLTAFFLYVYGQGPLRGFAIVLMIGIATSFFTSVYISHVVVDWMLRKGDDVKLSFERNKNWNLGLNSNFDFIGVRKKAYIFSISIIILGFILIAIQGLNLGVDFKGGRSYVVSFKNPIEASKVRTSIATGFKNSGVEVKNYDSNNKIKVTTSYMIENDSDEADEEVRTSLIGVLQLATGKEFVENQGQLDDNHFTISSSSKVGATIADDIKGSALLSGFLAVVSIFIYILIRFRKWQYSAGAIIAVIHDALFTFAAFAIAKVLGFSLEIDQVFVAALLTIVGYSINDTVIVFDRIREYIGKGTSHDSNEIFNLAINRTLSRTIITSGTVFFVVVVLFLFGGEVLRGFSFAMVVGVIIGTYSSIFIAAPLVIDLGSWKKTKIKN